MVARTNNKKNDVDEFKFHIFPKDEEQCELGAKQVSKGRRDFKFYSYSTVCSNHFAKGKPTYDHPYPTLYLSESDYAFQSHKEKGCSLPSEA